MRKLITAKKGFGMFAIFKPKHIHKRKKLLLCDAGEVTRKEIVMTSDDKKKGNGVDAFYAAFTCNVATFEKNLPQFLIEFPGEYVAILEGKVIAHMSNLEELARLTQRQYPNKFVFMERAIKTPLVVVDMDTMEG